MANKFQIKRTAITGRTPNTTNSSNTAFIDSGELAINLVDGKLFSTNGGASFEIGSNLSFLSVTGNTAVNGSLNVTTIVFSDSSTITTAPGDPVVFAIALG